MNFWFHFRFFERLGGATCERIRHPTFKGVSSFPYTLLKYCTFKHLTGQGESETGMLYEQVNVSEACMI